MHSKRVLIATLGLAAVAALALATPVQARSAAGDRQAQLASLTKATLEGDCCAPKVPCCPTPCVTYRHCGPKLCCGCEPGKEVTFKVKNPCTGCETDITVCMPACCKGEPEICCGTGPFHRDVVSYEWCCGYRVKVVFKKCGDLLVTTWGR